jgi:hypothetical protein
LDPPPPDPEGWVAVEVEEVELEEEAVAVPLLLPQAARIAVAASKRKGTRMFFSASDVRIDIFFRSLSALVSDLMISPRSLRHRDMVLKTS